MMVNMLIKILISFYLFTNVQCNLGPVFAVSRSNNGSLYPAEDIDFGLMMTINIDPEGKVNVDIESSIHSDRVDIFISDVKKTCLISCANADTSHSNKWTYHKDIKNGMRNLVYFKSDDFNENVESRNRTWNYEIKAKMADNPGLKNSENGTLLFTVDVGEKYLFVHEEILIKEESDMDAADLDIYFERESSTPMAFILPGITQTIRAKIRNNGNNSITNMKLTAFPPSYVIPVINNGVIGGIISDKFCNIIISSNNIVVKIPYVDAAIRTMSVGLDFKLREDDEFVATHLINEPVPFMVFTEIKYCSYDNCTDSLSLMKVRKDSHPFLFKRRPQLGFKRFRLKDVKNGVCGRYHADDEKLRFLSGNCFNVFRRDWESSVKEVASGKYLRINKEEVKMADLKHNVVFKCSKIMELSSFNYKVSQQVMNSVGTASSGIEYRGNDTSLCQNKTDIQYKLLPVWDNIEELQLRSVLSFTFDSYQYIVVCNPTGDLGNKFNCFYTSVVEGAVKSWTALSSYITNVLFIDTAKNMLYGKGNRGRNYFQLNLPDLTRVFNVQESNYLAAHGSPTAVPAYRLDQGGLTHAVHSTPFTNVGVSMGGVHYSDGAGGWKKVFVFGD
ncbi:uncharacterized protein LOC130654696 [Hydractinia symbiolongicarpus]|uniref:uncharacterized protein LOC130654696 n=1 Tax=Hydractinia symbiolongicarpus TaxID=13093 RepID=UPI00254DA969|nr:uncharacterized protein LOC130654696 [Hydractinia symbiolongicarpus]